jgi:hypothetical protein
MFEALGQGFSQPAPSPRGPISTVVSLPRLGANASLSGGLGRFYQGEPELGVILHQRKMTTVDWRSYDGIADRYDRFGSYLLGL